MAPASSEPQLPPLPPCQSCCLAEQQHETSCTHHYLHQLHLCTHTSQPWENWEKNRWAGGLREQVSMYTGISRSLKMLRAQTSHGSGLRAQEIQPRAILQGALDHVPVKPHCRLRKLHVLPSDLSRPRYRPHAQLPSDQHHQELSS